MSASPNKVLIVLWLLGSAAVAGSGFVTHAPNRLVSGKAVAVWAAVPPGPLAAMAAIAALLAVAAFLPRQRAVQIGVAGLASVALMVVLMAAGAAAGTLLDPAHPAARTSLGPAFWVLETVLALAVVDALQRCRAGPAMRLGAAIAIAAAVALVAASGRLSSLSLLREYATHRDAFAAEFGRHCLLVGAALLPAVLIGMPLGVVAARRASMRQSLFAVLNVVQTVPSIAVFGLLIAPLSALSANVPALAALGVHGIGATPAVLALIMYALLPVVRNTEAGIAGADPAVIDAAKGMGLTARQVFWQVEVPLAMPVLLAGIRIVLVQTIGLAAVAALIGAGGLGSFIFQGLGQYAVDLILLGAVPTILLALAADLAMRTAIDLAASRRRTT